MLHDAAHGDRGHHTGPDVRTFQGITHGQTVHHGGQHAHMITGNPIHAGRIQGCATEQIAAANHQANLHADANQRTDFQCHAVKNFGINTEIVLSHQGLATEFEQNTLVSGLGFR